MKTNLNRIYICALSICLALGSFQFTSCSDGEDTVIYKSLELSGDSFTFGNEGTGSFIVAVESSTEFEVNEPSAGWVTAVVSDNRAYITITASENESETGRTATIHVKNLDNLTRTITVRQLGVPVENFPTRGFVYLNSAYQTVMSPQGKYIAYIEQKVVGGDVIDYIPVVIEVETGEVRKHAATDRLLVANAVSDNGEILCESSPLPAYVDVTGTVTSLGTHADVPSTYGYHAYTLSSDGKTIGGAAQGNGEYIPIIWTDGTASIVTIDKTETYFGDPATTFDVNMRNGISSDGSTVIGTIYNNELGKYASHPCAYRNGQFEYVAHDALNTFEISVDFYMGDIFMGPSPETTFAWSGPKMGLSSLCLSPDGRYLALGYLKTVQLIFEAQIEEIMTDPEGFLSRLLSEKTYPMIYDFQTGDYKYVENDDFDRFMGITASNDGVLFFVGSSLFAPSYAYNMYTEETLLAEDWIRNEYGLIIPSNVVVTRVSDDGNTVIGYITETDAITTNMYFYIHR